MSGKVKQIMNTNDFNQAIIKLRQYYTQKEIAIELGITERTVRRWENGDCTPPQYLLPVIEKLLADKDKQKQKEKEKKTSSITFIDLFAGAGGISEGFLQAFIDDKRFEFLCASDINENCELTHLVRYNYQLGLDTNFLRKDITDPDFIHELKNQVGSKTVDVICGGPPCQSFSLAGKRRKHDKKDDLFSHYLEVIKVFQPKYFVMENVKGILTKENGKIGELIIDGIRSIINAEKISEFITFIRETLQKNRHKVKDFDLLPYFIARIEMESLSNSDLDEKVAQYVNMLEVLFKKFTTSTLDYKTSKSDRNINTIRHGLLLLKRSSEIDKLKRHVKVEKDFAYIDNDNFEETFNSFIDELGQEVIIQKINESIEPYLCRSSHGNQAKEIIRALEIFSYSFKECIAELSEIFRNIDMLDEFSKLLDKLYLYQIDKPIVVNASKYGVPQNRERVLFIGCRRDQTLITEIPESIEFNNPVRVYEALHDLDFLGNGENVRRYKEIKSDNGALTSPLRSIAGKVETSEETRTYAEWSRTGRLPQWYNVKKPVYVKSLDDYHKGKFDIQELHNHQTSNQNEKVIKRLSIIQKHQSYEKAKEELRELGLESGKRNYNVLNANSVSPTVVTMPDDYIHYSVPRSLTVREMARLQSFDDSFVFQGKRSTGGNKRKEEVPQYTLVGNAVPPVLGRAIAMQILRKIK